MSGGFGGATGDPSGRRPVLTGDGPAVGGAGAAAGQGLDARLLPASLCCWGATIATLTAGWRTGLALAVALAVTAIGLWVLLLCGMAHRTQRWRAVAVAALAAVVLGAGFAAAAAWREHGVATHPLRAAAGQSLPVVVTVSDDPKALRAKGFGGARQWVVRADLREFRHGGATVRAGGDVVILAAGQKWAGLSPGQTIAIEARVDHPRRADLTVVTLRAHGPPQPIGTPPWWQRAAGAVRADLATAAARALPPEAAGLLPALVVGDTARLPDHVREEFDIAGLQHLCVVSGANFTILLSVVLLVVRLLTVGPRTAATLAAGALLMFVVVARPDPSVLRAGAMGAVTLLALITGRRKQALPALCAAIIGLLAVWPALAVNVGFALSVFATAALILLAPSWADWLRARGWWRAPAEIVAVSAGAFVVTTPLMVAVTGQLSLVAVLANVLVAPVIAPVTVLGAAGALLACAWSPAAELVLRCAGPPMRWLLFIAEHAAALPGATVAVPNGVAGGLLAAGVAAALIAAMRSRVVRRVAAAAAFGVVAVLAPVRLWHPGWPPAGWIMAVCDVGQGDGLALAAGPGAAVVIDVGPDPRPIRACLERLRVSRVPLLVLTHPHADHIGGLTGVLRDRAVAAIAVGPHELDGLPSAETVGPEPALEAAALCRAAEHSGDGRQGSHDPPHLSGESPDSAGELGRTWKQAEPRGPLACRSPAPASGGIDSHATVSNPAQIAAAAARAGVPLVALSAGQEFDVGGLRLTVLGPSPDTPRPTRGAEADDANNRSVVIAADTPAGRILLTGDIEAPAQRALLRTGADLAADILKLPHHGSRTTTTEFLTAVRPRLALVSVGADNTFGHPSATVLAELSALGATVARTDRDGDIVISGEQHALRLTGSR